MTTTDFEMVFEEAFEAHELQFDRSQFVPSCGPLDALLMLVGEAPGEREVEQKEPFVGPAGKRLNIILESVGIERRDLSITNLIKVRLPGNRDPHSDEVTMWRHVLDVEIERVAPIGIITLGNSATHALLDTNEKISDKHGECIDRGGHTIILTYHLAATFYNDRIEKAIEEDMQTAAKRAGLLTT